MESSMHPRNPYKKPPDFLQLAEAYPTLKSHLIKTRDGFTIDFQNQNAQRCLTEALLKRDFGLTFALPGDRLCPPVPNRLNYILWLQDIMAYIREFDQPAESSIPVIIDVGTGASAIYPLLGCSVEPTWLFIATDVDERSAQAARENIACNNLQDRITVLLVDSRGPIFPFHLLKETPAWNSRTSSYDFTMCNPPFYGSRREVAESSEIKEYGPSAICTGADNEMITPGGEVAFIRKMVMESLQSKTRCRWYTTMLGKMSSLSEIVALLREKKIYNYAITEFVQGQTRRWAIAWSFTYARLPDSLARIQNPSLQPLMPPRNTLLQTYSGQEPARIRHVLAHVLAAVKGATLNSSRSEDESEILVVHAGADTWSRAARRRKLKADIAPDTDASPSSTRLVCAMQIGNTTRDANPYIEFQWVKGEDRALFESFMSHVGRKVAAALSFS